jgi:mono/diheme cytochrome c family protein
MKSYIGACVFVVVAAWGVSHTLRAQASSPQPEPLPSRRSRTVWAGVYTEEQAKRGASIYSGVCSRCHGDKLKGNATVPALTGSDFDNDWEGQTLDDIFKKIRRSMPKYQPDRLNQQQKVDVMAYILSFNRFPSGKGELEPDTDLLKLILFQSANPDAKKGN